MFSWTSCARLCQIRTPEPSRDRAVLRQACAQMGNTHLVCVRAPAETVLPPGGIQLRSTQSCSRTHHMVLWIGMDGDVCKHQLVS